MEAYGEVLQKVSKSQSPHKIEILKFNKRDFSLKSKFFTYLLFRYV